MTGSTPQGRARSGPRVMLYSHDTFGLGHLRRSRALASAITAADPAASALILTGSPVAGRFTFPPRVDHMRLPGVVKLPDGTYAAQGDDADIDSVIALRCAIIETAAREFAPDLFIVTRAALQPAGT